MLRPNPVDEAVLEQWGITVLTEPNSQPETALQRFLEGLANDMKQGVA
jgi:hypothetical protein